MFARAQWFLDLPGLVRALRFYQAEETAEGAWLWLETIQNSRLGPWGITDYAFAAHQLGYWNGIWATNQPLPSEPWLTGRIYRSWYPDANPAQDYKFPFN